MWQKERSHLGHLDCLQPGAPGDRQDSLDGEMRADGSELHPGLPPDPVRTTLGSGNALLWQIASFDETPARKAG